jgi:hypothetical protein
VLTRTRVLVFFPGSAGIEKEVVFSKHSNPPAPHLNSCMLTGYGKGEILIIVIIRIRDVC